MLTKTGKASSMNWPQHVIQIEYWNGGAAAVVLVAASELIEEPVMAARRRGLVDVLVQEQEQRGEVPEPARVPELVQASEPVKVPGRERALRAVEYFAPSAEHERAELRPEPRTRRRNQPQPSSRGLASCERQFSTSHTSNHGEQ